MTKGLQFSAIFVAMFAFSLAGCSHRGGSDSPSAAMARLKSALKTKDYKTAFVQMTPGCQNLMLGMIGLGLGQASLLDSEQGLESRRLLEKYNIKLPIAMQQAIINSKTAESCQVTPFTQDACAEVIAEVKDKCACFEELYAWSQNRSISDDELANANVTDLKIDADKATGVLKLEPQAANSYPIYFEKHGDRWLVDILSGMFVPISQFSNQHVTSMNQ